MVRAAAATGSGWQTCLIETLMAEHHYSLRGAIWGISLTAAFTLSGARADRLGVDRPGHADHAAGAARSRAKEYFQTHYQIL